MNEKGFTLIEIIIAFAIFLLITSLIPLFFQVLQPIDPKVRQKIETTLFFQQLNFELQRCKDIQVNDHVLHMINEDNQLVSYDIVNQKVRRQINRRGQEMVLLNIHEISFVKTKRSIKVIVTDIYGEQHKYRIPILVQG